MRVCIDTSYVDGAFVPVHGTERIDIINPATESVIGQVQLGNRDDIKRAIASAKRAQVTLAHSSKHERVDMLKHLQAALLARNKDIRDATIEEHGSPLEIASFVSDRSSRVFGLAAHTLQNYNFTRPAGDDVVRMEPVGVAALIASRGSGKLAYALAAGCASVIKPSEFGPLQAQVIAEAMHAAGLPSGVLNMVIGRGADVGEELNTNADVARISFTGSPSAGKAVARAAVETMKRVSLSLTARPVSIVLDDANMDAAVPMAMNACLNNHEQACVAGTRILVPHSRLAHAMELVQSTAGALRVGAPWDPSTHMGPVASRLQYELVQQYMSRIQAQGATLVIGGPGKPPGLESGFYVKPTVFLDVHNDTDTPLEDIFGPVLLIVPYDREDDAIQLANDSGGRPRAHVFSTNRGRALRIAHQLHAGNVLINTMCSDLQAPFGGTRQAGIGREFGVTGLEFFLEPKSEVVA